MNEADKQKRERRHQEDLRRLRNFRPIDDTFMRGLFKENLPLAQFVLRIITDKPDLRDAGGYEARHWCKVDLSGCLRHRQHRQEIRH